MQLPGNHQMPPRMNYRRGLLRAYTILSVSWVIGVLVVLPPERVKVWSEKPHDLTPDQFMAQWLVDDFKKKHAVENGLGQDWFAQNAPPEPPAPQHFGDQATRGYKAMWLAGILFLPPLLCYASLFQIVPWVYRGFLSETQR